MINCIYLNNCNKSNTSNCNEFCIKYNEVNYMMESARIPKGNQFKNELIPSPIDINKKRYIKLYKKW